MIDQVNRLSLPSCDLRRACAPPEECTSPLTTGRGRAAIQLDLPVTELEQNVTVPRLGRTQFRTRYTDSTSGEQLRQFIDLVTSSPRELPGAGATPRTAQRDRLRHAPEKATTCHQRAQQVRRGRTLPVGIHAVFDGVEIVLMPEGDRLTDAPYRPILVPSLVDKILPDLSLALFLPVADIQASPGRQAHQLYGSRGIAGDAKSWDAGMYERAVIEDPRVRQEIGCHPASCCGS